jgi:hypothetical protein
MQFFNMIRISEEEEHRGLDASKHGGSAYNTDIHGRPIVGPVVGGVTAQLVKPRVTADGGGASGGVNGGANGGVNGTNGAAVAESSAGTHQQQPGWSPVPGAAV